MWTAPTTPGLLNIGHISKLLWLSYFKLVTNWLPHLAHKPWHTRTLLGASELEDRVKTGYLDFSTSYMSYMTGVKWWVTFDMWQSACDVKQYLLNCGLTSFVHTINEYRAGNWLRLTWFKKSKYALEEIYGREEKNYKFVLYLRKKVMSSCSVWTGDLERYK